MEQFRITHFVVLTMPEPQQWLQSHTFTCDDSQWVSGRAERQQWHSAFSNQPHFHLLLWFFLTTCTGSIDFILRKKNRDRAFCLHRGGPALHCPDSSSFVWMLSWGPEHDSNPKRWLPRCKLFPAWESLFYSDKLNSRHIHTNYVC